MCTGINIERIPKEREKKLPGTCGKKPTPNRAENRENINNILQSPKKTAEKTAMVRNLKLKSVENLCLKFVIICTYSSSVL